LRRYASDPNARRGTPADGPARSSARRPNCANYRRRGPQRHRRRTESRLDDNGQRSCEPTPASVVGTTKDLMSPPPHSRAAPGPTTTNQGPVAAWRQGYLVAQPLPDQLPFRTEPNDLRSTLSVSRPMLALVVREGLGHRHNRDDVGHRHSSIELAHSALASGFTRGRLW